MTTSRERVMKALNFQVPDRLPRDFSGMRSTGISAFAYPGLVRALGLPPRLPRVYDTGQMLALPDLDVMDALGIDVVTVCDGVTNAIDQPEKWHDYDFNGRLPARVPNPQEYRALPDGTITQLNSRMPPEAYTFDEEHGGQPVYLSGDLPKEDLVEYKKRSEASVLRDEQIKEIAALCKRVRSSTDRAIFLNDGAFSPDISIHAHGGMAIFPILCITEPNYVEDLHEIAIERTLYNTRLLLPEIAKDVDLIIVVADDWGTQRNTIASPKVYRSLFLPYHKRLNNLVHQLAPQVKCFLHSCGAIYNLIDLIVESGFDILNPVQWSAGGHSYQEWKDKARGRLVLWGGGVNSQITLPLGSVEDVVREVRQVVAYLAQDSGYVFCNIHNVLAEITPEKVIAMYRTAGEF